MSWGEELAKIGLFLELDDAVTAKYYLIDQESALQKQFDQWAQWQWTCRLIEADTADVSGEIYRHFVEHPEDLYRLPHRDFEELISSVFTARGWNTQIGPGTADEGVDVRMWLQSPLGDALTLVQARRYAKHRPIGLEAVAALEAHSLREEAYGLFVTTSRYRRVASALPVETRSSCWRIRRTSRPGATRRLLLSRARRQRHWPLSRLIACWQK